MVSYAAIILLFLFIYFSFRYFRSVKYIDTEHAGTYKFLYGLAAVLFFAYPAWGLIQYGFTGTHDRYGFPDPMIYLFWYGLIFSGVMLNWCILHDLLLPLLKKFTSYPAQWLQVQFARLFLIVTVATLIFTASKLVWDTNRITTVSLEHTIQSINPDFTPLKVIHIADLHADSYTDEQKMARYVDRINQLEPDLVLFGGDLITSGSAHVEAGATALGNIESTYGTFAVLGDHDYWNNPDSITEVLDRHDVRVLWDENLRIDHNGHSVKITGITQLYSRNIAPVSLNTLLSDRDKNAVNILFAHQLTDRMIEQSKVSGVHLILGAHTHGGQIRIPFFFYKATAARAETKYVNGSWILDQMLLSINNGLGFTLSPVRYNAPAQVTMITLKPG
tara:strand:+ start:20054 stop:21223 length:1170 start_codon:yes stop_codon:yes gene_type:complete